MVATLKLYNVVYKKEKVYVFQRFDIVISNDLRTMYRHLFFTVKLFDFLFAT